MSVSRWTLALGGAALSLGALAMSAQALHAQDLGEAQSHRKGSHAENQTPIIALSVSESVRRAPDLVVIGAGVITEAPSAREAMAQNARRMDRAIARLKAMKIAAKDIQTSNFSLAPQYRYDREREEQILIGYRVSNQIRVKLRTLGRAGEVLDALVAEGVNNINGPSFVLEDDEAARIEARSRAYAKALATARQYARLAGFEGVELVELSEQLARGAPMPVMAARMTAVEADAATPIEPGEVETAVTIAVRFRLQ